MPFVESKPLNAQALPILSLTQNLAVPSPSLPLPFCRRTHYTSTQNARPVCYEISWVCLIRTPTHPVHPPLKVAAQPQRPTLSIILNPFRRVSLRSRLVLEALVVVREIQLEGHRARIHFAN